MKKILLFLIFLMVFSINSFALTIPEFFDINGSVDNLISYFNTPGSGTTTNLYKNFVMVEVSGVGLSKNSDLEGWNDAFYFLNPPNDSSGNGSLYLSFYGDSRDIEATGEDILNYLIFVDDVGFTNIKPVYSIQHKYNLVIDIGDMDRILTFGTGDGGLWDNEGYFDIRVSQLQKKSINNAVPEPTTLSLFGLGLLGFIIRRRK